MNGKLYRKYIMFGSSHKNEWKNEERRKEELKWNKLRKHNDWKMNARNPRETGTEINKRRWK